MGVKISKLERLEKLDISTSITHYDEYLVPCTYQGKTYALNLAKVFNAMNTLQARVTALESNNADITEYTISSISDATVEQPLIISDEEARLTITATLNAGDKIYIKMPNTNGHQKLYINPDITYTKYDEETNNTLNNPPMLCIDSLDGMFNSGEYNQCFYYNICLGCPTTTSGVTPHGAGYWITSGSNKAGYDANCYYPFEQIILTSTCDASTFNDNGYLPTGQKIDLKWQFSGNCPQSTDFSVQTVVYKDTGPWMPNITKTYQ